MLTYDLSKRGKTSLYEYLYRLIREDILCGKLAYRERLPSKRSLAENLGVSVITVENAYSQLLSEGYLYTKQRSGFYVDRVIPQKAMVTPQKNEAVDPKPDRSWRVDYTANRASQEFPFSVWAKLMRRTLSEQKLQVTQADGSKGVLELRCAISEYLYRTRGIQAKPENIVIGAGTEYISSILVQLFGQDKVFGIEDPGYRKTAAIYIRNGVKIELLPLDCDGVHIETLCKSKTEILHITPNHHYPTGIVSPVQRRQEILRWAAEDERRFVVEDDYDSEFKFSGKPVPTLQTYDVNEKVIYTNTFSKSLSPTMRISYMILPDRIRDLYEKKLGFYACPVPIFEQFTLAKFIDGGYFERHLNRMKTIYKARRKCIIESIESLKKREQLNIISSDAGLHFIIRVETNKSDEELVSAAAERGIYLSCVSQYSQLHEAKYNQCVLVNYSVEKNTDMTFFDEIL